MDPDLRLAGAKHKNPLKQFWIEHSYSVISYFSLAVLVLIVYHVYSDGDFSFLLTLGSVFNMFSFALLGVKAVVARRMNNVSLKTLQCYAVLIAARLCSILKYEGYLPYDKSGDFVYQACEVFNLLLVVALIAVLTTVLRRTYGERSDSFGVGVGLPSIAGATVLIVPALLVALLLHPSLNNNFFTDTAWAFSLYLEAVAIMPQLYMFTHKDRTTSSTGEIEPFEANFVFGIAVGRLLHFIFWLSSYHELNDKYTTNFGRKYPGHFVVVSQIINLLLMGDYCYYYVSASRRRDQFILPSTL